MVLAAACQITSTHSIAHNLQTCRDLISKAAKAGAKCIFLPEASDFIASDAKESYSLTHSDECKAFVDGIRQQAKDSSVEIGVHSPTSQEESRLRNTSLWIDSNGSVCQSYDKTHLFDVNIENGPILMESNSTIQGSAIHEPVNSKIGKVGLMVCFDLRFPEISLSLRHKGAHILTYPSAFTEKTGAAHWEVLLRARAIETQCYIIAAAQIGRHNEKRIVDPWGSVIAQVSNIAEKSDFCLADIQLDRLNQVRKYMPLHRRNDLYPKIT